MFGLKDLKIFSFRGTNVLIHPTFWLLAIYVFYLSTKGTSLEFLLMAYGIIFSSVLLHEFGHITAAKKLNYNTGDIILLPIGGAAMVGRITNPLHELIVTIAGPLVNVAIILMSYFSIKIFGNNQFLYLLLYINTMLAIFNIIPAFPMDGGRIFRSIFALITKDYILSTTFAVYASRVCCIIGGIYALFNHQIMLVLIAFFIWAQSNVELKTVRGN